MTKSLLDRLDRKESLGAVIIQLVVLMLAGAVLLFWQGAMLGKLGERIVMDARIHMVSRIVQLRTPASPPYPLASLSAASPPTMVLREAASTGIARVTRSAVTIVGALIFMMVLEPVNLPGVVGHSAVSPTAE